MTRARHHRADNEVTDESPRSRTTAPSRHCGVGRPRGRHPAPQPRCPDRLRWRPPLRWNACNILRPPAALPMGPGHSPGHGPGHGGQWPGTRAAQRRRGLDDLLRIYARYRMRMTLGSARQQRQPLRAAANLNNVLERVERGRAHPPTVWKMRKERKKKSELEKNQAGGTHCGTRDKKKGNMTQDLSEDIHSLVYTGEKRRPESRRGVAARRPGRARAAQGGGGGGWFPRFSFGLEASLRYVTAFQRAARSSRRLSDATSLAGNFESGVSLALLEPLLEPLLFALEYHCGVSLARGGQPCRADFRPWMLRRRLSGAAGPSPASPRHSRGCPVSSPVPAPVPAPVPPRCHAALGISSLIEFPFVDCRTTRCPAGGPGRVPDQQAGPGGRRPPRGPGGPHQMQALISGGTP